MTNQNIKEKVWSYIKNTGVCMMVTQGLNQEFQARPMHIVQNSYDGTLYFFTKITSPKVSQIKSENSVCLTFNDHQNSNHVTLYGTARMNNDPKLIEKFWNPIIDAWFPEGKDAGTCGLIEVSVEKGEYWDGNENPLEFFYEIIKSNIKDETPDLGENKKFG